MPDGFGLDHWGFQAPTLRNPILDIQHSTSLGIEHIQYGNPYALIPIFSPTYHSFKRTDISMKNE